MDDSRSVEHAPPRPGRCVVAPGDAMADRDDLLRLAGNLPGSPGARRFEKYYDRSPFGPPSVFLAREPAIGPRRRHGGAPAQPAEGPREAGRGGRERGLRDRPRVPRVRAGARPAARQPQEPPRAGDDVRLRLPEPALGADRQARGVRGGRPADPLREGASGPARDRPLRGPPRPRPHPVGVVHGHRGPGAAGPVPRAEGARQRALVRAPGHVRRPLRRGVGGHRAPPRDHRRAQRRDPQLEVRARHGPPARLLDLRGGGARRARGRLRRLPGQGRGPAHLRHRVPRVEGHHRRPAGRLHRGRAPRARARHRVPLPRFARAARQAAADLRLPAAGSRTSACACTCRRCLPASTRFSPTAGTS